MLSLTCLFISGLVISATTDSIPLRIHNPPAYGNAIAIGGVPFARGEAPGNKQFAVLDSAGRAQVSRQEPLSLYPDGSLRWLLVEIPVNAETAKASNTISLSAASDRSLTLLLEHPITIISEATAQVVSNGLIRFRIEPDAFIPFSRFERIAADGKTWIPVLKQMNLVIGDWYPKYHHVSTGDPSSTVEIEQKDPLHTIIRYRGRLLKSWAADSPRINYDLRLHVYADQPSVKADLCLSNICNDDWISLREINVDLLAAQPFSSVYFGGDQTGARILMTAPVLRQYQSGPTHYQPWRPFEWTLRDKADNLLAHGDRAPGWMSLQSRDHLLTVCLNEMWEKHAKTIMAGTDFARLSLWPRDADPLTFPRGAAISHQFILDARASDESPQILGEALSMQVRNPARLVVSPEQYCSSGVFGLLSLEIDGPEDYNKIIHEGIKGLLGRREREGLYGMLDYGDFPFDANTDEWTNLEYDLPHGCFLHFARTGDPIYLQEGLAEARHRMDVDVVRHDPDPNNIGINCKHHTGHTGRRDGETGAAKLLLDHTWNQSFWDYYFLTGERHAREVAMLNSEALMRATDNPVEGQRERNYGWATFSILETLRATHDPRYLDRIERILDDASRQQNPDGSFLSMTCDDGVQRLGGKPFMMGILMDAMYQAYEITPATRTEKFVKGAAQWLERLWIERDRGFGYSVCDMEKGRPGDNRELIGLYFAYKLTGERKYLDMAVKNFRAGVEIAKSDPLDAAKGLAIFMRATPNFVALCHREGISLEPDGWTLPETDSGNDE